MSALPASPRAIEAALRAALQPTALEVQDDSHLHAGHAGAREGRHFSVRITSARFAGSQPVARHRLVYDALRLLMPRRHPCAGHRGACARRALKPLRSEPFLIAASKLHPARRSLPALRPAPRKHLRHEDELPAVRAAFLAVRPRCWCRWPPRRRTSPSSTARPCRRRVSTTCMQQAARAGQQVGPEMKRQVRDQVVLREIFTQEAEKKRHRRARPTTGADGTRAPEHPDPRAVRRTSRRRTRHRRRGQGRIRQVQGPARAAPSTARATSWSRRKTTRRR